MFREMRRAKCALNNETAEKILREGIFGVLALSGDDGYNYAVPLNYAFADNKIYFHSALTGHKIDVSGVMTLLLKNLQATLPALLRSAKLKSLKIPQKKFTRWNFWRINIRPMSIKICAKKKFQDSTRLKF